MRNPWVRLHGIPDLPEAHVVTWEHNSIGAVY